MPEVMLTGCTPEPLLGYLKALGVVRLVHAQADGTVRGGWRGEGFLLRSRMDQSDLTKFFLEVYQPTPVVAPWAGGSGFFGSDNRKAVDALEKSATPRLEVYRSVIRRVQAILKQRGQTTKPSDEDKDQLLRVYRRTLPDLFVEWMDCALVLQSERQAFPPLLGTGGNDGRLDFTQNHMQRLVELGFAGGSLTPLAGPWLQQTLFGSATASLLSAAVGQFDPGRAGGPNAGQGMEGGSLVNPWDFVLMIEGTLVLAGSVARRLGAAQRDKAAFPFTVRPSAVGYASGADAENASSHGEIWLPLWSELTSLPELRLMFAEGRAELAGRQARDGVDFARAVAGLGVDRGIDSFVRYGFLKRSGKAFVAAPLGRFEVRRQRAADLLHHLDSWLTEFRRACREESAPPRFSAVLHRIDEAMLNLCRHGGASATDDTPARMSALLRALGQAERELANGERFRKNERRTIHPAPSLSATWLDACDDGTSEYRLARSLAFITGDAENKVGPLRANLEPVQRRANRWEWAEKDRSVVWSGADLCRNLLAVLERRVMDGGRVGLATLPLGSLVPASLNDVGLFLSRQIDDERLEQLLWGLMLIDARGRDRTASRDRRSPDERAVLPRPYALLKLLFLPSELEWSREAAPVILKPEPEILGRLRAYDLEGACEGARRRLWANGLTPLPGPTSGGRHRRPDFVFPKADLPRLLAALLFPVSSTAALVRIVLRPEDDATDGTP
jgi:CRISPR-associated protein Csx17